MKNRFLILLFTLLAQLTYGQAIFDEGIQVTNTESTTAPYVNVQEATGVINRIAKGNLINVVEVADFASLPVTGEADKIYITEDTNLLYRWDGSTYVDLTVVQRTPTELLDAVKTVDGTGSGLDADLFQGQEKEDFYHKVLKTTSSGGPANVNKWTKILEVELTQTFATYTASLSFLSSTTLNTPYANSLELKVRQASSFGNDPVVIMIPSRSSDSAFLKFGYKIVRNTPDSFVEIYVKATSGDYYTTYGYLNMDRPTTGSEATYLSSQPYNATVTGLVEVDSYKNITSQDIDESDLTFGGNIEFTEPVKGVDAVNPEEFVTKSQAENIAALPDATTSVKGIVKLAGDLAGTADSPTVPKLNAEGVLEYNSTDKTVWNNGKGDIITNTSFGEFSMLNVTSGGSNSNLGASGLYSNTSGSSNSNLGAQGLYSNTSGSGNSNLGSEGLRNNTTGDSNSNLGYYGLNVNSTGDANSNLGFYGLLSNTTGDANSNLGFYGLLSNTTGGYNSSIGYAGLASNIDGTNNSNIGRSGLSNVNGSYNSSLGASAGAEHASGDLRAASNSVFLGAKTKALANNSLNEIVIGYDATGAGDNTATLGASTITYTVLRGVINAVGIPTYADNAAAILGGLVVGDVYKTVSGDLKIVIPI